MRNLKNRFDVNDISLQTGKKYFVPIQNSRNKTLKDSDSEPGLSQINVKQLRLP